MSYMDMLEKIKQLPVIDTHEHLSAEGDTIKQTIDVFNLFLPYICDNLMTAGMKKIEWDMLLDKSMAFEERWKIFEPYLDFIKFTTYFQTLFAQLKIRYEIADFDFVSAEKINSMLLAENVAGLYDRIKKQCNIESIFTFISFDFCTVESIQNSNLFAVPTVSDICIRSRYDINRLENSSSTVIADFDALTNAIDILFKKYKEIDVKAIKFGSAYRRKLNFEPQTRYDAEKVFLKVIGENVNSDTRMFDIPTQVLGAEDVRVLDDYLTDYMIALAAVYDFKVFFHAGLHAWNENNIEATRVFFLEGLIRRHRNAEFILLHCGMPFIDDAVLLCKYFSNVHLNLTWCHIIDREQAKLLIIKIIEMLPLNKIHGFGGDYCHPIQIIGHLQTAYENIAKGLWHFVERDFMSEAEAISIAKLWLYENPKKLLRA